MTQVLTEQEKTRRAELNADTRQALQMGLSLDEFLVARQACTEDWTGWLHREMQRCNTDDPVEVLPAALARVEQQAVAEARRDLCGTDERPPCTDSNHGGAICPRRGSAGSGWRALAPLRAYGRMQCCG
jgi:hypothetical protein